MPENNTRTPPTTSPVPGTHQRASLGEIGAFVAETKRMLNGGSASLTDRAAFFEWKADLFARLGESASAEAAAVEAVRLRGQLGSANERGVA